MLRKRGIKQSVRSRITALTKGIGTSISYEKDGKQTEAFSVPDAENIIELNGIRVYLEVTYKEKSVLRCMKYDYNS